MERSNHSRSSSPRGDLLLRYFLQNQSRGNCNSKRNGNAFEVERVKKGAEKSAPFYCYQFSTSKALFMAASNPAALLPPAVAKKACPPPPP